MSDRPLKATRLGTGRSVPARLPESARYSDKDRIDDDENAYSGISIDESVMQWHVCRWNMTKSATNASVHTVSLDIRFL